MPSILTSNTPSNQSPISLDYPDQHSKHFPVYSESVQHHTPPQFDSVSSAHMNHHQSLDINNNSNNPELSLNHHLSQSPSPIHPSSTALPPRPISSEHLVHPYSSEDNNLQSSTQLSERQSGPSEPHHNSQHSIDKYSNFQSSLLDQRRMSEPAALSQPLYQDSLSDLASSRYQSQQSFHFAYNPPVSLNSSRSSLYPSVLHRGASTGSLRDLRHSHLQYPPQDQHQQSEWNEPRQREQDSDFYDNRADGLDGSLSPMQPNFSGGLLNSPTSLLPYSSVNTDPYGPSPPGTGTSTSSSIAPPSLGPHSPSRSFASSLQRSLSSSQIASEVVDRKTYSFVALPGNTVKKRPRRRYDEIERLYQCSWPDCNKSYGTLNHLNAHVTMQKHGPKRSPNEFKELRKQWRKAKKESEAASAAMRRESYSDGYDDHVTYNPRYLAHRQQQHALASSVSMPHNSSTDRFAVSIDDIRYPLESDDGLGGGYDSRPRSYGSSGMPASWHGNSSLISRAHVQSQHQQHYESNSVHPSHHSQLPHLAINRPSQQQQALNRLPQNSTLLTPLPGYHNASIMEGAAYPSDGFDFYDDESNGRPGTGHASIGGASDHDFDHH